MTLTLTRISYGTQATTGRLSVLMNDYYTVEQPWRNNEAGHSCVPDGQYNLIPYLSGVHGPTWCLDNPALGVTIDGRENTRSRCELHAANWASQLQGCIAIGLDDQPMLDPLTGLVEPAIEDSRDAVQALISTLGQMSSGHILIIKPEEGIQGTV
jgi:hypothetical protein